MRWSPGVPREAGDRCFLWGVSRAPYGAMGVSGILGIRRQFGVPVPGGSWGPMPYCTDASMTGRILSGDFFCLKMMDRIIG